MFDPRQFIRENFTDVGTLIARCNAGGITPPSPAQTEKWLSRNSLPCDWLVLLLLLLEAERGAPVSLRPYVRA